MDTGLASMGTPPPDLTIYLVFLTWTRDPAPAVAAAGAVVAATPCAPSSCAPFRAALRSYPLPARPRYPLTQAKIVKFQKKNNE